MVSFCAADVTARVQRRSLLVVSVQEGWVVLLHWRCWVRGWRRGDVSSPVRAACAVLAGAMLALSLPPRGWWVLLPAAVVVLTTALRGCRVRGRVGVGSLTGLSFFLPSLSWLAGFSVPGYLAVTALQVLMLTGMLVAVPSSPRGWWALPASLVLLEAVRMRFPFGGFPIPGLALSQLDGPFMAAAPWGGGLLVVGLSASAGTGVYALLALPGRQRMGPAAVVTVLFVSGLLLAALPAGTRTSGRVDAAVAQGGGPRGLRAVFSDSSAVTARQFEVSPKSATSAPQLLVWPEDVVTVTGPVNAAAVAIRLSGLATALHATLVVGVVENDGTAKFRNAAVAWAPDGRMLGRYEKVHRVPFGEYIPLRSLFQRVTDATTLVPRDAIPGRGPGILSTPAGPLGVLISYEVFFPDRARAAVKAGAGILLVPTNAASYTGKEVPAMEVAAARLRAAEFQRSVLQAAPTGYSAIIDPDGTVAQRSGLGAAAYLRATVSLRTGQTLYSQAGDRAQIIAAIVLLLLAWARASRLRAATRVSPRRGFGQSSRGG